MWWPQRLPAGDGRGRGRPATGDGDGRGRGATARAATATGDGEGRRRGGDGEGDGEGATAAGDGDGRDGGSSGSGVTYLPRAGRGGDRAGGPKVRRPAFHGFDSVGHSQRAIRCDPCRSSWNASRLCLFSVRCRIPVAPMAKKRHQIATRYILCTEKDGPRPIEASS